MEDDWESVADKDVVIRPIVPKVDANKWDGEDDDEDVKDSWEQEDEEEKKDEEKNEQKPTVPVKTKPNKALKAKLAEQERLAEEEEAKRLANMTPEEKLAEKLRLQKIQEESDLRMALQTFGVNSVSSGLDSFNPQTKEEFKEFGATLSWKISQYKESPLYVQFMEDLVRSLCATMSTGDIKKIKIAVENLHSEKLKLDKQNAKKPASKGKAKATIRAEADDIEVYQKYGGNDDDDYDDFM